MAIQECAEPLIVVDDGGVEGCVLVEGVGESDGGECMRQFSAVVCGILRDDIDGATDGRASEESGAATAHHLYALYHIGWYLFKAIYAR